RLRGARSVKLATFRLSREGSPSAAALNEGRIQRGQEIEKVGQATLDTFSTNASIAAAVLIYVVYTAIAGPRDYKKLIAGQRLWFFRKWSSDLGLLTLGGAVALLIVGRGGDVLTFPAGLAPVHEWLSQPIAAVFFWLLFAAFCALMAAPLVSTARLAPNEVN